MKIGMQLRLNFQVVGGIFERMHAKILRPSKDEDAPASSRLLPIKVQEEDDLTTNVSMIVRFFTDLGEFLWFETLDNLKDKIFCHPMEFIQDCR